MSREFYQDGWGRRQNKYNQDNCPCKNQIDADNSTNNDRRDECEYENNDRRDECEYENNDRGTDDDGYVGRQREYSIRDYENDDMLSRSNRMEQRQPKCCPFDAYGITTNCHTSYTMTNVVKDHVEDICIPFTVSVTIPTGFILPLGCNFEHSISISRAALSMSTMTQYYVCADLDDCNCGCPEVSKMQVVVLNGPLYYNVTVTRFAPAQPLQGLTQEQAAYFNKTGKIAIDKIIGYVPIGCEVGASYTIDVVEEKHSITLQDGRCLSRKSNCEEYQCLLVNPDIEKTLNFSYKVIIKSVCLNK